LNAPVDKEKMATSSEHARDFTDEFLWRTEMMRGHTAGHQIETRFGIGHDFGRMFPELHRKPAALCGFAGALEHRTGQVRQDDPMTKTGQIKPSVPGAR